MKPGSKYYPLFQFLQEAKQDDVLLSFDDIEVLLGTLLPASARNRKNWWSNRDSPSALQASAWINASYHVKSVDLIQHTVLFQKFHAQYTIELQDGNIVWHRNAIKALRKHMNLTQAEFAREIGVRRQTVSEWENGVYDPDRRTAKFLDLVAEKAQFET